MANRRRPGAGFQMLAQEARLCESTCRRVFRQGVVQVQVVEKTFGLSEVVAGPGTGRRLSTRVACRRGKSRKAGARLCVSAHGCYEVPRTLRVNAYGTVAGLWCFFMYLWCGSVITLVKDRVAVVRVFSQEMEEVGGFAWRLMWKENFEVVSLALQGQLAEKKFEQVVDPSFRKLPNSLSHFFVAVPEPRIFEEQLAGGESGPRMCKFRRGAVNRSWESPFHKWPSSLSHVLLLCQCL